MFLNFLMSASLVLIGIVGVAMIRWLLGARGRAQDALLKDARGPEPTSDSSDPALDFPVEVWVLLLRRLDPESAWQFGRSCKTMYQLVRHYRPDVRTLYVHLRASSDSRNYDAAVVPDFSRVERMALAMSPTFPGTDFSRGNVVFFDPLGFWLLTWTEEYGEFVAKMRAKGFRVVWSSRLSRVRPNWIPHLPVEHGSNSTQFVPLSHPSSTDSPYYFCSSSYEVVVNSKD
jgi:hypothetical protein